MSFLFENKAITLLTTDVSSVTTTVVLGSGEGAKFPSPTGGDVSTLVFENRLTGDYEIAYMTARTGDQLTLTRGQEGTTPASWETGSNLSLRATAAVYTSYDAYDERITQNESDIATLQTTTDDLINVVINKIYPVGSTYISSSNTNPATVLGVGTWAQYAEGRALVGVGGNGEATWIGGEARGSETHTLVADEVPAHTHGLGTLAATTNTAGDHSHAVNGGGAFLKNTTSGADGTFNYGSGSAVLTGVQNRTTTDGNHSHTVTLTGDTGSVGLGSAHNNVQPSIGIYVWRRTA